MTTDVRGFVSSICFSADSPLIVAVPAGGLVVSMINLYLTVLASSSGWRKSAKAGVAPLPWNHRPTPTTARTKMAAAVALEKG